MLAARPAAAERHGDHPVDAAQPVGQVGGDHPTSQTGSGSPPPRRRRRTARTGRSERVNQRSWVTATTVPSKRVQALPPAPRRWPGRGCRWARRAAAGWPRTAPAAAPGTGPAARRRACRSAGRPGRPARSGTSTFIAVVAGPARRGASSPRQRISTSVFADQLRPVVGLREVARAAPGRPSRATPSCATGASGGAVDRRRAPGPGRCRRGPAAAGSATCRCRWRRAPPPGRRTRSPGRTGRSGPSSSSCSQMTARLPVRPPRSRIRMSWSFGGTGGGPASSNLRSRVCAAW